MAQTRPVTADIGANIERHKELVASASSERVDAIIFPELSLTGYEPTLARELACDPDERRFEDFQQIANDKNIVLGVGVPTRLGSGNRISMIFFRPHVGEQEVAVIAWSGKGAPAYPRFLRLKV